VYEPEDEQGNDEEQRNGLRETADSERQRQAGGWVLVLVAG
jgi:hypothetical protein